MKDAIWKRDRDRAAQRITRSRAPRLKPLTLTTPPPGLDRPDVGLGHVAAPVGQVEAIDPETGVGHPGQQLPADLDAVRPGRVQQALIEARPNSCQILLIAVL